MKEKITRIKAVTVACAALLLPAPGLSPLSAQEPKPPGVVIWDGKITISRQASAKTREDKREGGNVFVHFENRTVNDVTVIEACGTGPLLKVYSAERSLEDRKEKGTRSSQASTDCGYPEEADGHNPLYIEKHFKRIIRTPGNKSFRSETMHTSLYEGEGVKPLEGTTAVTLMVEDGGVYTLTVQSFALVLHLQDHLYKDYNACTGKTKQTEHYIRPATKGQPPGSSSDSTKPGGDSVKITRQTLPPLAFPAGFTGEGAVSGTMLEGEVELIEKKSDVGGYEETTRSTWSLAAKDPCQDAYNQLLEDLAWAEAYVNADIQSKVERQNIENIKQRIKTYEKLVNQQVYRILHGEEPPEGELADTDAYVDGATGKAEGLDELKDRLARECKPDIIYDSIEKHERTHQKQEQTFEEEYNSGDVVIFGLMEVTAYLAGIHMLIDWLERNCPEVNLTEAKTRVQRIEKAKFSRPD
jgi:hypothetical protein